MSGRDANQPATHPTDRQIINFVRSMYGMDFAEAVEQALAGVSWAFAMRVRESFVREMAERDA